MTEGNEVDRRVGERFGLAIRSPLEAVTWVEAAVPKVFGEWMPGAKWTVTVGFAVNYLWLSTMSGLLGLGKQRPVRATARFEATRQKRDKPNDPEPQDHPFRKGRTRPSTMERVVSAAKTFVWREIPLVCRNCTRDGIALNHAIPNVEVRGGCRLAGRRPSRPPGWATASKKGSGGKKSALAIR